MDNEQGWSDVVKRAMERTLRIIAIKRGEITVADYTQEDFDRELKAAMWRAEPDDFDPDEWTDHTTEDA